MKTNEPILIKRPKEFLDRISKLAWIDLDYIKNGEVIIKEKRNMSLREKIFETNWIAQLLIEPNTKEYFIYKIKPVMNLSDTNMIIDFINIIEEYSKDEVKFPLTS